MKNQRKTAKKRWRSNENQVTSSLAPWCATSYAAWPSVEALCCVVWACGCKRHRAQPWENGMVWTGGVGGLWGFGWILGGFWLDFEGFGLGLVGFWWVLVGFWWVFGSFLVVHTFWKIVSSWLFFSYIYFKLLNDSKLTILPSPQNKPTRIALPTSTPKPKLATFPFCCVHQIFPSQSTPKRPPKPPLLHPTTPKRL